MMYQIEVITTSEDEETRIVRFNPKVLQQALDESFENKIKVNWHNYSEGYREVKLVVSPIIIIQAASSCNYGQHFN